MDMTYHLVRHTPRSLAWDMPVCGVRISSWPTLAMCVEAYSTAQGNALLFGTGEQFCVMDDAGREVRVTARMLERMARMATVE
jgi:hypothetical protein